MTAPSADSIYVLMGRVLRDLPAIGKGQFNAEQKFKFRGIDDVLDKLNPVLSDHGVFFVPEVLERVKAERTTRNGGVMHEVNLHVRFRFYGPAGDFVEASAWGEGTDMGDKATNKAMTGAMKYVLFQTFAIATAEQAEHDADLHAPEESVSAVEADALAQGWESDAARRAADKDVKARIKALGAENKALVKQFLADNDLGFPLPSAAFDGVSNYVDELRQNELDAEKAAS